MFDAPNWDDYQCVARKLPKIDLEPKDTILRMGSDYLDKGVYLRFQDRIIYHPFGCTPTLVENYLTQI